MPIVTAIAPDPEPRKRLTFRERVYLHALAKFIRALMNNRPCRAAFWLGFLEAVQADSLKG